MRNCRILPIFRRGCTSLQKILLSQDTWKLTTKIQKYEPLYKGCATLVVNFWKLLNFSLNSTAFATNLSQFFAKLFIWHFVKLLMETQTSLRIFYRSESSKSALKIFNSLSFYLIVIASHLFHCFHSFKSGWKLQWDLAAHNYPVHKTMKLQESFSVSNDLRMFFTECEAQLLLFAALRAPNEV